MMKITLKTRDSEEQIPIPGTTLNEVLPPFTTHQERQLGTVYNLPYLLIRE